MKLRSLLEGIEITETNADMDAEVTSVSSDSRNALPGGVFICIAGRHNDGHLFIGDALSRGAQLAVVERRDAVPENTAFILTPDTRIADAFIWDNFYGHPSKGMTVLAVTGTNGKTSVAFMLRQIFERAGKSTGMISTVKAIMGDMTFDMGGGSSVADTDGAMTTPDPEYLYGTIRKMRDAGAEVLIFEASSHALFLHKTDPISVDVAIFTNLSEEHLDFHGSMEEYLRAKARLMTLSSCAVINIDDRYIGRLASAVGNTEIITCSASDGALGANAAALRVKQKGLLGIEYIYYSSRAVFTLCCPIPGCFTVYNTMLAATAALRAGIPAEFVRDALASVSGIEGRLEKVSFEFDVPFTVIIDYAHTPAALESLLETVRSLRTTGQKLTLLFGCGGDRDRSKRQKMGAVASRLADFVIVTGDNSRSEDTGAIIEEIMSGINRERPHAIIRDREAAIRYAIGTAVPDEIIVLAGKGHENYEICNDGKKPFCEKDIVRDAVRARFK